MTTANHNGIFFMLQPFMDCVDVILTDETAPHFFHKGLVKTVLLCACFVMMLKAKTNTSDPPATSCSVFRTGIQACSFGR